MVMNRLWTRVDSLVPGILVIGGSAAWTLLSLLFSLWAGARGEAYTLVSVSPIS